MRFTIMFALFPLVISEKSTSDSNDSLYNFVLSDGNRDQLIYNYLLDNKIQQFSDINMKEMMDTLKAIDDHKETEAEKKVIPEEINKKPVNEKEDNFFESLPNLLEKFRLFMSPSDYNDLNQLFTRDDSPLNLEGRKRLDRDFNSFMQFIDSMLKGKPISEMEMANVCTIINNLPPLFIQLDQWAKKYERQKKEKLELKEL